LVAESGTRWTANAALSQSLAGPGISPGQLSADQFAWPLTGPKGTAKAAVPSVTMLGWPKEGSLWHNAPPGSVCRVEHPAHRKYGRYWAERDSFAAGTRRHDAPPRHQLPGTPVRPVSPGSMLGMPERMISISARHPPTPQGGENHTKSLTHPQHFGSRIPWAFQWLRTPGRYPGFNCWILGWPIRNSQAREYLGPFSGYGRWAGALASIAGYLVGQLATRRLANILGLSVATDAGSVPWLQLLDTWLANSQLAGSRIPWAFQWLRTPGRYPGLIDSRHESE